MGEIRKFEQVEVEKLIPYINNAKKHDEAQVTKIAASIREFGFLNPVLIDKKYNVIAGHGRILAAKKLGLDKIPAIYAEGLTEAQRKAYILADNRLGELAEWDEGLLDAELRALDELDFNIELTGFKLEDDEEEPPVSTETSFNYKEQYGVIVMCRDEVDQEEVYNRLTEEGYECKVVAT